MREKYLKINSLKLGISTGIIGALITLFTTLTGIYGYSKIAEFMATSLWGSLGYSVSWTGAFLGIIIGFVYAFVPVYIGAWIYNKLV